MDILDILLDILLKPPQPFIGLFLFGHVVMLGCVPYMFCGDIVGNLSGQNYQIFIYILIGGNCLIHSLAIF